MLQERKNLRAVSHLNKQSECNKDNIIIKFASTTSEFIEAMELIQREYVRKGLVTSNELQPYFSPHLIMPNNRLVIALKEGRIIGTISLIEDSPIGVPMDNVHLTETMFLRKKKAKFAEVGSFAVDSEYQHQGITLLLYKAIFSYVCQYRNIEYILAAVHPRVAEIYNKLFKFEKVGKVQEYTKLNNAKSVPLRLNTKDAIAFIQNMNTFNENNYAPNIEYLLNSPNQCNQPSITTNQDLNYISVWHENFIQKYFNQCRVDIKSLPEKQRLIITWLYPTLN